MTKQEMLNKLGTTEPEWDSYLAKTYKFVNEGLDSSERELHKRLFSKMMLAILPSEAVNPQELSELYEARKILSEAVIAQNNVCGKFPIPGEIEE
jgi:hypothetical protein